MRFTLALLFPALALAMRGTMMDGAMDGPKPWQTEAKTKKKKTKKSMIAIPKDLKVFAQKGFDSTTVRAAPKWVYQCRKATEDKSDDSISAWKECMSRKFEAGSKGEMTYKVEDMEIVHEMMEVNADPEAQVVYGTDWKQYMCLRWYDDLSQYQLGWKIHILGDPKE